MTRTTTKYWFDTEFIEDGKTIELISIGIVAEDGRTFYAENSEADLSYASDWVRDNVINQLCSQAHPSKVSDAWIAANGDYGGFLTKKELKSELLTFLDPATHGKPEFWAYYADYDWVAFCQIFGTMMDLPSGYPMYCRDIKQWADMLDNPTLPPQLTGEHNALADAKHNVICWEFLNNPCQANPTQRG